MSDSSEIEKTLALAGVFQAAALARQLARRGYADEEPMAASVRSILITDAINTASVFGGPEGVRLGLMSITGAANAPGDMEVARYAINLVQLSTRLEKNGAMLQKLATEIERIKNQFSVENESDSSSMFEQFAEVYKSTISNLKPRIIVQGEQGHLANDHVVVQVRTSLLAGIRSAFLWSQLGGRRWHLIFYRKRYTENAKHLLRESGENFERQSLH